MKRKQLETEWEVQQVRSHMEVTKTENLIGVEAVYCVTKSLANFKHTEIWWKIGKLTVNAGAQSCSNQRILSFHCMTSFFLLMYKT